MKGTSERTDFSVYAQSVGRSIVNSSTRSRVALREMRKELVGVADRAETATLHTCVDPGPQSS